MDWKLAARIFSTVGKERDEAILEALRERDRVEKEYDDAERAKVNEWKEELNAEKAEADAIGLTVVQLRRKKHDDRNKVVMKNVHDIAPHEIRWLWPGKIPLGKVTLFSGDPDRGKSYVTLDIATRVTRGLSWPGKEEGEVGEGRMEERGNAEGMMGRGEEGEKREKGERENASLSTGTCSGLECDEVVPSENTLPVQAPMLSNKLNAGSVILITSEDNGEDTIRPRLDAMHADTKKVEIITHIQREEHSAPFSLHRDLDLLERGIEKLGDCKLVIIDPLASYLELNGGGASSIRQALDPLKALAERTGVAVILVNHLSKGTGAALHRSLGSISIIGMCRTAWAFARDKADRSRRYMLPLKNNLSPDDSGFAFTILDGRVEWENEPIEMSIDEAMKGEKKPTRVPFVLSQAAEWLESFLKDGQWQPISEIEKHGNDEGFSFVTLKRAKRLLKIEAKPAYAQGPWRWRLPQTIV